MCSVWFRLRVSSHLRSCKASSLSSLIDGGRPFEIGSERGSGIRSFWVDAMRVKAKLDHVITVEIGMITALNQLRKFDNHGDWDPVSASPSLSNNNVLSRKTTILEPLLQIYQTDVPEWY